MENIIKKVFLSSIFLTLCGFSSSFFRSPTLRFFALSTFFCSLPLTFDNFFLCLKMSCQIPFFEIFFLAVFFIYILIDFSRLFSREWRIIFSFTWIMRGWVVVTEAMRAKRCRYQMTIIFCGHEWYCYHCYVWCTCREVRNGFLMPNNIS